MSKDISQYSFAILLDDDVSAKFFLLLLLYFVYICIFTTRINRVDGVMKIRWGLLLDWFVYEYAQPVWGVKGST